MRENLPWGDAEKAENSQASKAHNLPKNKEADFVSQWEWECSWIGKGVQTLQKDRIAQLFTRMIFHNLEASTSNQEC